jgi:copper chaperone CopZ
MMKKFVLALSLVLFFSVGSLAEMIRFSVPEMTCGGCAGKIKKRLEKEAGVSNIESNVKAKTMTFSTAEGTTLSDEQIVNLVKEAGYKAENVERIQGGERSW